MPIAKGNQRLVTLETDTIANSDPYEMKQQLLARVNNGLIEKLERKIIIARRNYNGWTFQPLPDFYWFKLYKNIGNKFELITEIKVDRLTNEIY